METNAPYLHLPGHYISTISLVEYITVCFQVPKFFELLEFSEFEVCHEQNQQQRILTLMQSWMASFPSCGGTIIYNNFLFILH